jgi:hypothetical protein
LLVQMLETNARETSPLEGLQATPETPRAPRSRT